MMFAAIREFAGFYLVLTLTATGLAKLRMRRVTINSLRVEGVIPRSLVAPVVVAVSAAEILLAVSIVSRRYPLAFGLATAAVFVAFGGYKMAVVIRTGWTSCSCTGTSIAYKTTRPAVVATILVPLIQAALACLWAFLPQTGSAAISGVLVLALVVPVLFFLRGALSSAEPRLSRSLFRPGFDGDIKPGA